jgi:hypothetical protein
MRSVVINRGWNQTMLAGAGALAVAQGFDASASTPGDDRLDRFGRIAELRFDDPGTGSGPVAQLTHGYAYREEAPSCSPMTASLRASRP